MVLLGFGTYSVVTLGDADRMSPAVVRVVGSDDELWAYTQERSFLQGVETAWWVSLDGGTNWSAGDPTPAVVESEPEEEICGDTSCFRLVDGVRIERRAIGSSVWQLEHERPTETVPPSNEEYRRDWEAERSLAVAERRGREAAVVAAGKDGALVRDADGGWKAVSVGRSWFSAIRWWLIGVGGAAALIGGLVVDQILRRIRPARPTGPVGSEL